MLKILDRVTPGTSRSLGWEMSLTLLSFPASIMLNRFLGAEDRGLLALIILIPTTVFTVGTCQWDRLLQGLVTSKQVSSLEAWRRTVYYTSWLSAVVLPLGIVVSLLYEKLPLYARWLSAIYCINFPLYLLGGCLSAIYVASGSIDGQYSMRIGLQGSYLALLCLLFTTNHLSVSTMIVVYFSMHLFSLLIGWRMKGRLLRGKTLKSKPPAAPLAKAFIPYLFESFAARIDIWAFSFFAPLITLGQYTGITALMVPVGLLSNAMTSASTARLDWNSKPVVTRYLLKTAIALLCLLIMLGAGGVLVGPYLLETLLGKSFSAGYWMIPWIAALVGVQAAAIQFHTALRLAGKIKYYLLIQTIEPFARLTLVFTLAWQFSEMGIIVGMIIASLLKIIACFCFHNFQTLRAV